MATVVGKEEHHVLSDYRALESGSFTFKATLPVSNKSTFGDGIWDWNDENNPRLAVTHASKLRVNWNEMMTTTELNKPLKGRCQSFRPILPGEIVDDLKRA